jgi:thiosulfate dehydrogenase [quinone] large subunit
VTAGGLVHLDRKKWPTSFSTLGINMLIHSSGRFLGPSVEAFSSKTTTEFACTPLPGGVVPAFLMVMPFAEFIVGSLITLGLSTRWALTLGGC